MVQIFLVEDEERVAAFIEKALRENNYEVDISGDGAEAIRQFANKPYDVVILDVNLPYLNGIEVCRYIRQKDKNIPILMLTALDSINDKVNGLNTGADDYMVKPFHFKELIARIEALLRRKNTDTNPLITLGDLTLDTNSNTVERAGHKITLTTKEYALLELLMRNSNKILSRQIIAEKVWGIEFDTGTNVVDVYVNYLRNKVEKGFATKHIHTVVGKGYIFKV
ncbi:two-component system copper resistance phosphate regulon response regulator CusR [Mucilaginibacter gracilis]|uniref:Two-component system copper resistance phosphate regulon response regulator CusR n=1 Tax=Mucilaginibacter gracilis TaxID=423350 RepID=A0A495IVJ5_9SPHI|nr:response regulator transcription factor [Mucilaginibacter gracilis]RKR80018.1 two-component system copper resistance phosphate regulon response regulator CusR [Mucilaginibacter gracilis]